ncbi:response regulator [Desulfovibrio ferrophilus]|uniref:Response regulator receiver n=1 Tax=Desulfovibrio ferrophilus TaxID=241368 RepID=A0A2Z6AVY0_9BACT|nr:two-component system response regulator [Desulfovibrio ferrophilus]BBD07394.1 response regulator receiver [Desulfovibrio ferrophilus]
MMSDSPRILIVDDTPANIRLLADFLREDYQLSVATNGADALIRAQEDHPDLVLLDIMMPEMDGYEVLDRLKSSPLTAGIPVIFVTAMSEVQDEQKGLDLGAVDYIAKPFHPGLVKARVRNHLDLKRHRDHLEDIVQQRTYELAQTKKVTVECLAGLAETRDPETGGHIRRTQNYVRCLAQRLSEDSAYSDYLTSETVDMLYRSAPLHDVGKVGVPDGILLKPGKLTEEEFEVMKRHAIYGREALRAAEKRLGTSSFLRFGAEIAYTHHECWDGSGYPQGLAGEDIPLSGRLMAVADVYDALISQRVYKSPFEHSKAVRIILEGMGSHFDPAFEGPFRELSETFRAIAMNNADSDAEREALRR